MKQGYRVTMWVNLEIGGDSQCSIIQRLTWCLQIEQSSFQIWLQSEPYARVCSYEVFTAYCFNFLT